MLKDEITEEDVGSYYLDASGNVVVIVWFNPSDKYGKCVHLKTVISTPGDSSGTGMYKHDVWGRFNTDYSGAYPVNPHHLVPESEFDLVRKLDDLEVELLGLNGVER